MVELTRKSQSLLMLISIVYLSAALIGSFFPAIVLLVALVSSWSTVARLFADTWVWWAFRIAAVGPCFAVAYAFLRHRKWGWYLLIAYNSSCLVFLTVVLLAGLSRYPGSMTGATAVMFLLMFLILGGFICLMFQKDVKVLKTQ